MTATVQEKYMAMLAEKEKQQAACRHAFRPVKTPSGFMPYLQCVKCGKRKSDD
jgi:hypothetical protein